MPSKNYYLRPVQEDSIPTEHDLLDRFVHPEFVQKELNDIRLIEFGPEYDFKKLAMVC